MAGALLFFNEKEILVKDKSSGLDLFKPYRVDVYNKFTEDRVKHLIQEHVIQKDIDIEEILFNSNEGILIPNEIYNPDKKEDYFTLNYPDIDENKSIFDEKIDVINAHFISTRLKWFVNFCKENMPQTPIMNSSKKYLERVLGNQKDKSDVHIVLKPNTFDLIKLQNQKLFSFNCIEYTTVTDVVYFLVAHLEKLPKKATHVVLYGREEQTKEIKVLFQKIKALSGLMLTSHSDKELIQFLS
jgi:hypothetical protein